MKKRIFTVLLAALMTMPMLVSCGDAVEESAETVPGADTAAAEGETEPSWQFPDVDYGGAEYRVLNFDQLWDMYIDMDVEEQTGDILDDAVYDRNRKVEDELNCVIAEKALENVGNVVEDLTNLAYNNIMAGSDEHDMMCLPIDKKISLITEGCLMDMMPLEGFHFEEEWWDQYIIDAVKLDGKLYFTSGAANLMAYDSLWGLFFNENIMEEHGLDKPYDLVREGKWTLDKLAEYCAAVANLNGDETYAYKKDGNVFWGLVTHDNGAPEKFLYSAGVRYVQTDADGNINFTLSGDHVYNVFDKMAYLLNQDMGMAIKGHTTDFDADLGGYMYVFTARRSMFLTAEIKAAQLMRDMEDTFGIVPFPKANEAQENYQSTIVSTMLYWCIPATNSNLEMTATVSEVLTHESYVNVIPVYYNSVVEHKGLRNEDSIEMLDIMRQNKGVDIGAIYAWNVDLSASLRTLIYKGDSQVASTIAKAQPGIETKIAEFKKFLTD